jgi:hypothetical protein
MPERLASACTDTDRSVARSMYLQMSLIAVTVRFVVMVCLGERRARTPR